MCSESAISKYLLGTEPTWRLTIELELGAHQSAQAAVARAIRLLQRSVRKEQHLRSVRERERERERERLDLQGSLLDGHSIELKLSNRETAGEGSEKRRKVGGSGQRGAVKMSRLRQ